MEEDKNKTEEQAGFKELFGCLGMYFGAIVALTILIALFFGLLSLFQR